MFSIPLKCRYYSKSLHGIVESMNKCSTSLYPAKSYHLAGIERKGVGERARKGTKRKTLVSIDIWVRPANKNFAITKF